MAAFDALFNDPRAAIGIGLLTNQGRLDKGLATGVSLLTQGQQLKRQEREDELQTLLTGLKLREATEGKSEVSVNPVTGEWVRKNDRLGTVTSLDGTPIGNNVTTATPTDAYSMIASPNPQMQRLGAARLADERRAQDAQRDADRREQERSNKLSEDVRRATIPGYELNDPNSLPTAPIVTDATKLSAARDGVRAAVGDVKGLISREGSTTGFGTDVDEANAFMTRITDLERQLGELGVLNGADLVYAQNKFATFDPRNKTNWLKSRDEMRQAATDYQSRLESALDTKLNSYGYRRRDVPIQAPAYGPNGTQAPTAQAAPDLSKYFR